MKKLLTLLTLVLIVSLSFANEPVVTPSADGTTWTVEYTIPYGQNFSINKLTGKHETVGDAALEQVPDYESIVPVLWVFKTGEKVPGKLDITTRTMKFTDIKVAKISGFIWNMYFPGKEHNYWTYGNPFTEKVKGKKITTYGYKY